MDQKYISGTKLITRYVYRVFPLVNKELHKIAGLCINSKDRILSDLALRSIQKKKFHAQGGSVYALYPKAHMDETVKFIVSFQTISDYLDNLCDSAGIYDEKAFRQLHYAMQDAVTLGSKNSDYYRFYPYKEDNGYLNALVDRCKKQIAKLPSYDLIKEPLKKQVELYSDLQSLKHLSVNTREKKLQSWSIGYLPQYKEISTWEFSAATGSTLNIFLHFASAWDRHLTKEDVRSNEKAYFPWINGLHILLDYYIDYAEDIETNELNFTSYYNDQKECEKRLMYFTDSSLNACAGLKYPEFHTTIVKGLLAMYLSDPKAYKGFNRFTSKSILRNSGRTNTYFYHKVCKVLRLSGAI
ncbi:MAG TPA: tetraprenyl-beta-curcumene synthase family protein [Pseudobacteroides sp.]|uniref:tetraprenyl-beta-curcumene synthase family protein n=1 Tax=Pseudobacteroides sp. TaxID=1968840 RepID=UPI002F93F349